MRHASLDRAINPELSLWGEGRGAAHSLGPVLAQSGVAAAGAIAAAAEESMKAQLKKRREQLEGKVLVPALLWMAGMPFGLVFLIWLFFFRGK
jgi:hypothetical protein